MNHPETQMSDAVYDTCAELPVREVMEGVKLGVSLVKLGDVLGWLRVGTSKAATRAPRVQRPALADWSGESNLFRPLKSPALALDRPCSGQGNVDDRFATTLQTL